MRDRLEAGRADRKHGHCTARGGTDVPSRRSGGSPLRCGGPGLRWRRSPGRGHWPRDRSAGCGRPGRRGRSTLGGRCTPGRPGTRAARRPCSTQPDGRGHKDCRRPDEPRKIAAPGQADAVGERESRDRETPFRHPETRPQHAGREPACHPSRPEKPHPQGQQTRKQNDCGLVDKVHCDPLPGTAPLVVVGRQPHGTDSVVGFVHERHP